MMWRVDQGDCRELLRGMAAESVHICVTSPPYWGLRDYGLPPLVWGGDEGCEHSWGEEITAKQAGGTNNAFADKKNWDLGERSQGSFCHHCHAWRGSLGLEPTPELYIAHMVEVFREVKRVLRKDGTLWCNMGDGYASQQGKGFNTHAVTGGMNRVQDMQRKRGDIKLKTGLKPKDLMGMPWRLAFALQADGWWLRSEIIWAKPNPMPESVRDRPTKAHETVFLLTKAARYYYDQEAVREGRTEGSHKRWDGATHRVVGEKNASREGKPGGAFDQTNLGTGRNRRSVWTIPTHPFPGAHFATFPPKLIEPMILTSPTKVCAACGKGWERVVESKQFGKVPSDTKFDDSMKGGRLSGSRQAYRAQGLESPPAPVTLGFRPGCDCLFPPWVPTPRQGKEEDDAAYAERIMPVLEEQCVLMAIYESAEPEDTVPATVLDCFLGSGTSIMVALRHGRNAIGLELSKTYAEMARRRIVDDAPLFNHNGGMT